MSLKEEKEDFHRYLSTYEELSIKRDKELFIQTLPHPNIDPDLLIVDYCGVRRGVDAQLHRD